MGCKCLGPGKKNEEVYLKLIRHIHSHTLQDIPKIDDHKNDESTILNFIETRLTKNGDIRRLKENLSSRKHKIQDSLIFNLKQMTQAKNIISLYAGLKIANAIIDVAYP